MRGLVPVAAHFGAAGPIGQAAREALAMLPAPVTIKTEPAKAR
jgi:hypothetical protein